MGWGDALATGFEWLGGDGFAPTATRLLIGYEISRYLNQNNNPNPTTSSASTGARQQIQPATNNRVPLVYGSAYLGGVVTDVQLTNSNRQLWAVLTLCEQTGDLLSSQQQSSISIDQIYMSNQKVVFKSDGTTIDYLVDDTGVVDSNPSGLVSIYLYNGSNNPFLPSQEKTTLPIAGTPPPVAYEQMPGWDASYEMGGLVFAIVQMNYDPSKGVRSIPQLKFRVNNTLQQPGDVLFDYMTNVLYGAGLDPNTIDQSKLLNLNSYSSETVCYSDNAPILAGSFGIGQVYQISSIGSTDFTTIGASSNAVGAFFTATGAGSGSGIAYLTAAIPVTTIAVGQKYTIASPGTTNFTLMGAADSNLGTTFNATKLGLGTGTVYPNFSGPRYQINGVIQTSDTCMAAMQKIALSSGSDITYDITVGKWSLLIHQPTPQTLTFDDSNIVGQIALTSSNMDQYYNQIEIQYPYAVLKDQTNLLRINLPAVDQNPNEVVKCLQQTLDLVNNSLQATIIGNQLLRQNREDKIITFTTDYSMFGAQIGDVLGVTNSVFGWSNEQFRIVRMKKNEADTGQLTLEITAQSYNPDVYTIDSINYFIPLIGAGHSIPNLGAIQTPVAPTVTSNTISSQPSISITAIVPSGVVNEMEFWYATNTSTSIVNDGSLQIGQQYTIVSNSSSSSDFTSCGASDNNPGTVFIATLPGTSPGGVATYGSGNVSVTGLGSLVTAANLVAGTEYLISNVGTTNFTTVGASANSVGIEFIANGPATGTGTAVTSVYTLLGSTRADNSGSFTIGQPTTYKSVLLLSDTYVFKTRAGNSYGTSKFSPASAPFNYTYVATPSRLPYQTPIGPASQAQGGDNKLALGLVAAYLASKLNWFGNGGIFGNGNATLSSVFGISSDSEKAVQQSVMRDAGAAGAVVAFNQVNGNGPTFNAGNGQTINFAPGQHGNAGNYVSISAVPGTNTVVIDLTSNPQTANAANGSTSGGTISSKFTLTGNTFPALFGSGPTVGTVDSRAGIFTHDLLVFGGNNVASSGLIDNTHKIFNVVNVSATISGNIQNFYNFPSLSSSYWSRKPNYVYDPNKYTYDSAMSIYYATATYTSGNLDQQSWSNWHLMNRNDGVTGMNGTIVVPAVYANTWSNPTPTLASANSPYVVEESTTPSGIPLTGNVFPAINTDPFSTYDPFKANVLIVNQVSGPTTTVINNQEKALNFSTGGVTSFNGGPNDLIIFGASPYNLTNLTPFATNTVFGHVGPVYVDTYPNAISFNLVANNGSRFVAVQNTTDNVYYSDDYGVTWTRVELNTQVTDITQATTVYPWSFLQYDGTKFILYNAGFCATSTDGKTWIEHNSTVDLGTVQVCAKSGKYLAVGTAGYQTSTDGVTWTAPAFASVMGGQALTCCSWDGVYFYVGGVFNGSAGAPLYRSTNGTTWTVVANFSNPNASQSISSSSATSIQNAVPKYPTVASLP